ncbi:MAG TPA: hypothetical protein VMZ52_08565 [Bryobacteraceae bacterium]|nr:hypothetical protein [Bryobacteraceae bacterium]
MIHSLARTSDISGYSPSGKVGVSDASAGSSSDFALQLSDLIAKSLQASGRPAGELHVRIIDDKESSTGKEIIISYSPTTGPAIPDAGNPFLPRTNTAPDIAPPRQQPTEWSRYDGPRDSRDEIPAGGGKVTATGSPVIQLNEKAAGNQYNYAGRAARNPYFTSPSNPLRSGYVLGFENWFDENQVMGGVAGPVPMNKRWSASAAGAQEALRLVREYLPEATLGSTRWGEGGGPFAAARPTQEIVLADGRRFNAGAILNSYYTGGEGVTAYSDKMLEALLRSG